MALDYVKIDFRAFNEFCKKSGVKPFPVDDVKIPSDKGKEYLDTSIRNILKHYEEWRKDLGL